MKKVNDDVGAITAISGAFALFAEFGIGPAYDIYGRKIVLLVCYFLASVS